MEWLRRSLVVVLAVATMLGLAGCGESGPQAGFDESTGGNEWEARFGAWDGTETQVLDVADERSLLLSYETSIEEGRVTFVLTDVTGEAAWELAADGEVEDTEEIPLPDAGDYKIVAYGANATGEFRFSWKTR